jgi:hypothetical protein
MAGRATLGFLASVATQVRPGIFVGAEARYLRKYDGLGLTPFAVQAWFLGPTMFKYGHNKRWHGFRIEVLRQLVPMTRSLRQR